MRFCTAQGVEGRRPASFRIRLGWHTRFHVQSLALCKTARGVARFARGYGATSRQHVAPCKIASLKSCPSCQLSCPVSPNILRRAKIAEVSLARWLRFARASRGAPGSTSRVLHCARPRAAWLRFARDPRGTPGSTSGVLHCARPRGAWLRFARASGGTPCSRGEWFGWRSCTVQDVEGEGFPRWRKPTGSPQSLDRATHAVPVGATVHQSSSERSSRVSRESRPVALRRRTA